MVKKAAPKAAAKKPAPQSAKAKKAKKAKAKPVARKHVLKAADMAKLQRTARDPRNAQVEQITVAMGAALGLSRHGIAFSRVPAGKAAAIAAASGEEWIYILYGQGVARIGASDIEIGAGDFVAFPAPGAASGLSNTGWEDLVFLHGGESAPAAAPRTAPAKKAARKAKKKPKK